MMHPLSSWYVCTSLSATESGHVVPLNTHRDPPNKVRFSGQWYLFCAINQCYKFQVTCLKLGGMTKYKASVFVGCYKKLDENRSVVIN